MTIQVEQSQCPFHQLIHFIRISKHQFLKSLVRILRIVGFWKKIAFLSQLWIFQKFVLISQSFFASKDVSKCWWLFWFPTKVIYPKYSKHWPYTVVHTIDCVCSKMLNHGLFLSLFKLIPYPTHWIVYVLAYLNFIFEF